MKQTKSKHLQYALELLLFMIAPIMRTDITPIYLGMLYVLFYFCIEVIGWMYIKSVRNDAQQKKLLILTGFGVLSILYGVIIGSWFVAGISAGLIALYIIMKKYI